MDLSRRDYLSSSSKKYDEIIKESEERDKENFGSSVKSFYGNSTSSSNRAPLKTYGGKKTPSRTNRLCDSFEDSGKIRSTFSSPKSPFEHRSTPNRKLDFGQSSSTFNSPKSEAALTSPIRTSFSRNEQLDIPSLTKTVLNTDSFSFGNLAAPILVSSHKIGLPNIGKKFFFICLGSRSSKLVILQ